MIKEPQNMIIDVKSSAGKLDPCHFIELLKVKILCNRGLLPFFYFDSSFLKFVRAVVDKSEEHFSDCPFHRITIHESRIKNSF